MIDWGTLFKDATIAGVPLLLFVIALVQEVKQDTGLTGAGVRILAIVIGLILGVGYQISTKMPATFAEWFTVVIFGLLLGLGASRLYDASSTAMQAALRSDRAGARPAGNMPTTGKK